MAVSVKNERRKELRDAHKTTMRRELLIADYVQCKYSRIYAEAMQFYNLLNDMYPNKNDLKKTDEYRFWKKATKTASNFSPHEEQPEPHGEQPEPHGEQPEPHEEQPEPHGEQPEPHEEQPEQTHRFQLRIPLIKYPLVTSETEEILSSVTPETGTEAAAIEVTPETGTLVAAIEAYLEESAIQPFLHQEISPEVIEKILEELRAEPELHDMFKEIEEQILFDQIGMDIDIPETDLLEQELENW